MVTPAARGSRTGNEITAARWARRLGELGHRVQVRTRYAGEPCDLLVALHARKSASAVRRFHATFPDRPVVVVLTGTDVYHDLALYPPALRSLEIASRIVLLQPLAAREIAPRLRRKAVVILQSATTAAKPRERRAAQHFDVLVLAHLRPLKDPLRAARAARLLPIESRLRVVHAGRALSPTLDRQARREAQQNPRYVWLGSLPPARARALLAGASALVSSSRLEGGANAVSEAIVAGVPVLATRIPGAVGLLGAGYPGYFEFGDTRGLARLLHRIETQPRFRNALRRHLHRLAPRFTPDRERAAWAALLRSLPFTPKSPRRRRLRLEPQRA